MLDAPIRSWIAPLASSLRSHRTWISPRSVLQAPAPHTDCSVLDAQHSPPVSDCSCPVSSCFAPPADCSALNAWRSVTVYGLLRTQPLHALVSCMYCSVLNTSSFAPKIDCSMFDAWRFAQIVNCSTFFAWRPVLPADRSVINTSEFCIDSVVLRLRHLSLRPVCRLLDERHLALSFSLRISPPASVITPVLLADRSAHNT